jgi:hypothetical protein
MYRPSDDVTAYDAFCDQIAGAPDLCVRDDSTECSCSSCRDAEEDFWREQGEGDEDSGPCSHVYNGDRCENCDAEHPQSLREHIEANT